MFRATLKPPLHPPDGQAVRQGSHGSDLWPDQRAAQPAKARTASDAVTPAWQGRPPEQDGQTRHPAGLYPDRRRCFAQKRPMHVPSDQGTRY